MSQFKNVNVVQYKVINRATPNEARLAINRWDNAWGPQALNGALAVLTVDDTHATTAA